jgi:hypothetical protein
MGIAYSTDKVVPEFFWPHSDESRYVINMTWDLLIKTLDELDRISASVYFKSKATKNLRIGMERGKTRAYLNVLARFDGMFCGEQDKVLIEARKELGERNRPIE